MSIFLGTFEFFRIFESRCSTVLHFAIVEIEILEVAILEVSIATVNYGQGRYIKLL